MKTTVRSAHESALLSFSGFPVAHNHRQMAGNMTSKTTTRKSFQFCSTDSVYVNNFILELFENE
jgi:hypothetical protein